MPSKKKLFLLSATDLKGRKYKKRVTKEYLLMLNSKIMKTEITH